MLAYADRQAADSSNKNGFIVIAQPSGPKRLDRIANEVVIVSVFVANVADDKTGIPIVLQKGAGFRNNFPVRLAKRGIVQRRQVGRVVAVNLKIRVRRA